MHIHSYQIHNVLNVYRKQLSQNTFRLNTKSSAKNQAAQERIEISVGSQRQSLFDKISSEIVERIARFGPDTEFEAIVPGQMAEQSGKDAQMASNANTDASIEPDTTFTYTVIDEHNQKITHRLPIQQLSLPNKDIKTTTGMLRDCDIISDSE